MSEIDKKSVGEELTEDFVLAKLRSLENRQPSPAKPTPVLGPYHKAASVLTSFNADLLEPMRTAGEDSEPFEELLADCTIVYDARNHPSSMLRTEVRRRTLQALGTREAMQAALAANPVRPETTLQKTLEDYIAGNALSLEKQNLDQLAATLQVSQWLPSNLEGLPDVNEVQRLLEQESLLKPFRDLADKSFHGRHKELEELRAYVDYLTSESILEYVTRGLQRFLTWNEKPPLIIHGPGGMGKSALISKFVLEHLKPKEEGKLPITFVYLDFDRPSLIAEQPRTLLMEAARQLTVQIRSFETMAELLRQWLAQQNDPRRPELETMLAEFGRVFRSSTLALKPILFVLDTFEVVQHHQDVVASVFRFLAALQTEIPGLRAVVVGRAPVKLSNFPTENSELQKLSNKDAVEYLVSCKVPPSLASKVASQVSGNPLSLKLAVEVIRHEGLGRGGITELEVRDDLFRRLEDNLIQGQLYRRILGYIKNKQLRKLAHPGLVLRRVTPELIFKVLAKPCDVKVQDMAEAQRYFADLQCEVSLVTPAEDGSLHHRPEVREAMLKLLRRDEPKKVQEIHKLAVDYYTARPHPTVAERAERLYHMAALPLPQEDLDKAWEDGFGKYLSGALPELPPRSRVVLATKMGVDVDEEARKYLRHADEELAAAQRARALFQLERPQDVLFVLRGLSEPGPLVYLLRAEALCQLGSWAEARDAIDSAFVRAGQFESPNLLLKLTVLEARVRAETARPVELTLSTQRRFVLHSALLDAFPQTQDFAALVDALDVRREQITRVGALHTFALNVINWATAKNRLEDLIAVALRLRPTNQLLRDFAETAGITPVMRSAIREGRIGERQSFGRRLVLEFERAVRRFLDDPRLLRIGVYELEELRKRGQDEPHWKQQLEDAIAALFDRISQSDLSNFVPLCYAVAGCIGHDHPGVLRRLLLSVGMPDLSADDRSVLAEALAGWDRGLNGQLASIAGVNNGTDPNSWGNFVSSAAPTTVGGIIEAGSQKQIMPETVSHVLAEVMSRAALARTTERVLYDELEQTSVVWKDSPELVLTLSELLSSFDWAQAQTVCEKLIDRLRVAEAPLPQAPARQMLTLLRRKRRFDMMAQLAKALLDTGQDAPIIRRQYVQALIETNRLNEARAELNTIVADSGIPRSEKAEARRLAGRIEKQLYVSPAQGSERERSEHLLRAIELYYSVYVEDPASLWYGINVVGLLARAAHDGVAVTGFPNMIDLAREIDMSLREKIDRAGDLEYWDYAVAVETAITLGNYEAAYESLMLYIADPRCDAFEIASMLRHLTELWQLSTDREPGARLLPILRSTLLKKVGGQITLGREEVAAETTNIGPSLERVFVADHYQSFEWYKRGLKRAAAVASIETREGQAIGTAFLVLAADFFSGRPDSERLLLTATHLIGIGTYPTAISPEQAIAVFEASGQACPVKSIVWSSPVEALDATFVSVDGLEPNAEYCPVVPPPEAFNPAKKQRLYILGHSGGRSLSVSLQDSFWLDTDGTRLHYRTPSESGSSGSPVFDETNWTVVAMHHSRSQYMPRLNNNPGTYEANEGIAIAAIQRATLGK